MTKLTELDPRWLILDGKRVGFIFRSPTRRQCWQSCFEVSPPRQEQWRLFAAAVNGDDEDREFGHPDIQGCKEHTAWSFAGGIQQADFETLTVTPSIDGSPGGNWHGFITNGQIVGGMS